MKTLYAALLSAISFQAEAQQCTPLSDIKQAWEEQNINTDLVFSGQGDNGNLTYIFRNPDNGRWSEWIASPTAPTCVQLYDQGSGSRSEVVPFTTAEAKPAEHNL